MTAEGSRELQRLAIAHRIPAGVEGPDDKGEADYKIIILHGAKTICTGMLPSYEHAARLASSYSQCVYPCVLVASYPGPCGLGMRVVVLAGSMETNCSTYYITR